MFLGVASAASLSSGVGGSYEDEIPGAAALQALCQAEHERSFHILAASSANFACAQQWHGLPGACSTSFNGQEDYMYMFLGPNLVGLAQGPFLHKNSKRYMSRVGAFQLLRGHAWPV